MRAGRDEAHMRTPLPDSETARAATSGRRSVLLAALLIAVAAFAAYANTFRVPFVFDDIPSIQENPTIRHLWPVGEALSPPRGFGMTVSGRPLLNLTLAVNYALSGEAVWSYHALNLLIHALAGLTLFGLVRRTLLGPVLSVGAQACCAFRAHPHGRSQPASLQSAALPLALVVALLWTLHPLQTEAVTYTVQRAESLMGLCYLLTLYCSIRGMEAEKPARWQAGAVAACLAGMASKEVMVSAPLLVLLYDRTFVAGSFREAWRWRWRRYAGLAATWVLLGWLVASTGGNRGGTFGAAGWGAWWSYWLTQFEAVARYLGLVFWPHPLVFAYGVWRVNGLAQVAPYALIVVALLGATVVALWRRPVPGFFGCVFFVLLAPTSLLPGTLQMIVEHRMYLPLAAVIALVVGTVFAVFGRRSLVVFFALAVVEGVVTFQRNADYRTDLTLWQDTVAKAPDSGFAQSGLGTALHSRGHWPEAMRCYQEALRLQPDMPVNHYNLGLVLAQTNHWPDAVAEFAEVVRLNPRHYPAHYQLGIALTRVGRPEEALGHFAQALQIMPGMLEVQRQWGLALFKLGRVAEAVGHYVEELQLDPTNAGAESDLGSALFQLGRGPEAATHFEQALRLKPDLADTHFDLGLALARMGRGHEAGSHYAEAVRLNPNHGEAQLNLGIALAQAGRPAEALEHLQAAVRVMPDLPEAHDNLAIFLAESGRLAEAMEQYRQALRLKPDYAGAHFGLGNALAQAGRFPEAILEFQAVVRLAPDDAMARHSLGNALLVVGRVDEAMAEYREVLRTHPDDTAVRESLRRAQAILSTPEPAR
jgi:tetratricopeptide (TPR) repeat protein